MSIQLDGIVQGRPEKNSQYTCLLGLAVSMTFNSVHSTLQVTWPSAAKGCRLL